MAKDTDETLEGGYLRDKYGRRELVLAEKHAAPGATALPQGDGYTDADGREQVVLLGADGRSISFRVDSVESATGATNLAKGANKLTGDDSTDNTDRLQAWLDTTDVEALYLPEGIFRYESVLSARTTPLTIFGPGTLRSSLGKTVNTAAFWLKGSHIHLRDLTFDFVVGIDVGAEAQTRAGNAHTVRLGGTSAGAGQATNVSAKRVKINDSRNTPILAQWVSNYLIGDCVFTRAYGNGLFVGDSYKRIRLMRNSISDCGDDLIGVYQNVGMAAYIEDVLIAFNDVDTGDAKGIGMGGVKRGRIIGNGVDNTYTPGIMLTEDAVFDLMGNDGVIVAKNMVRRGGKCYGAGRYGGTTHNSAATIPYGIAVTGSNSKFRIRDNEVRESEGRGLSIDQGTDFAVTGNDIDTAGGAGIQVGDPDGTVYTKIVRARIAGNKTRLTVGGIIAGAGTDVETHDNEVSSYKNGASGTRRGITYGKVSRGKIRNNTVVNDDGGNETIFTYNATVNVDRYGNKEDSTGSDPDKGIEVFTIGDGRSIGWHTAAPTTGTWKQGDVIFDKGAGGTVLPAASGWQCRAAGTPGTWKQFGHLGIVPYTANATWDPSSVADGATTSTTITVTGVGPSDAAEVLVGHSAGVPAGAILSGSVTAANTVTVTLFNKTGGALDLASGTLRVTVYKHQ